MTFSHLMLGVARHGLELAADGDRVLVRPARGIPPDLREALKRHESELLTLLRRAETAKQQIGRARKSSEQTAACEAKASIRASWLADWVLLLDAEDLPEQIFLHGQWVTLDRDKYWRWLVTSIKQGSSAPPLVQEELARQLIAIHDQLMQQHKKSC